MGSQKHVDTGTRTQINPSVPFLYKGKPSRVTASYTKNGELGIDASSSGLWPIASADFTGYRFC
jgi:hypothetical protein